jgi:hypothetical protein
VQLWEAFEFGFESRALSIDLEEYIADRQQVLISLTADLMWN